MKKFIQWFFIIGAFFFLFFYIPFAMSDGMVSMQEIGTIVINFVCIFVNLSGYLDSLERE
jgi:hypothetical protein